MTGRSIDVIFVMIEVECMKVVMQPVETSDVTTPLLTGSLLLKFE